ncbi:MAG: metallopeptidase TldD-related protein [candidate division WOR-3 bacterium]
MIDLDKVKHQLIRLDRVSGWFLRYVVTEAITVIRLPRIYSIEAGRLISSSNPAPREVIISPGESLYLTVYSRFDADGSEWLGDATSQVLSDEETAIRKVAAELVEAARSERNKPFPLPAPDQSGVAHPALADPELAGLEWNELLSRAQEFNEQVIAAASRHDQITVSNLELFIRRHKCCFESSTGISVTLPMTRIDVEVCFLARPDEKRTGELTARLSARRLSDIEVDRVVDEYAVAARKVAMARAPQSWSGPVVLRGEAMANAFEVEHTPLAFHSSARMVYEKSSRYAPGRLVTGDEPVKGELLNLVSDPLVPFGLRSAVVSDVDGTPCRRVALVTDGCFDRLVGSQRYFHYLGLLEQGVEPPGTIGNTVIPPGTRTADELCAGDCLVVHAFSSWEVDSTSGDFACEVRLGEVHNSSGVTPFKGGLLVGNWFAALADVHYSRELQQHNGFHGPLAARFGRLQLAT